MNHDFEDMEKPKKKRMSAAGAVALACLVPGLITAFLLVIFLVPEAWLAEVVYGLFLK